jgi:hypothetical protein
MGYNLGLGPGFDAGTAAMNGLMRTINFTRNQNYQIAKDLGTAPSAATNFKVYEDSRKGFRVSYPSDWEMQESDSSIIFISPLESSFDRYREGITIFLYDTNSQPLHACVEYLTMVLSQKMPGFGVMWSNPTTIAGNDAHELHFSSNVNDLFTEINTIMTINNNTLYVIEYHAELGKYYNQIANQITSSFEFI